MAEITEQGIAARDETLSQMNMNIDSLNDIFDTNPDSSNPDSPNYNQKQINDLYKQLLEQKYSFISLIHDIKDDPHDRENPIRAREVEKLEKTLKKIHLLINRISPLYKPDYRNPGSIVFSAKQLADLEALDDLDDDDLYLGGKQNKMRKSKRKSRKSKKSKKSRKSRKGKKSRK
jgi:hypothetical protein